MFFFNGWRPCVTRVRPQSDDTNHNTSFFTRPKAQNSDRHSNLPFGMAVQDCIVDPTKNNDVHKLRAGLSDRAKIHREEDGESRGDQLAKSQ